MSTLSQFGFGGGIKSIQRGIITLPTPPNSALSSPGYITQTATISSVNTSKSILFALGQQNGQTYTTVISGNQGTTGGAVLASLELTNSTTITATSGYHYGQYAVPGAILYYTVAPKISWQLVEYY